MKRAQLPMLKTRAPARPQRSAGNMLRPRAAGPYGREVFALFAVFACLK